MLVVEGQAEFLKQKAIPGSIDYGNGSWSIVFSGDDHKYQD